MKKSGAVVALVVALLIVSPAIGQDSGSSTRPPQNLKKVGDHWTAWDPPAPAPGAYVIVKDDTLWDLAGRWLGDPFLWPQIWDENRYILDSHWIYPGDPLVIPGRPTVVPEGGPPAATEESEPPATEGEPDSAQLDALSKDCEMLHSRFSPNIRGLEITVLSEAVGEHFGLERGAEGTDSRILPAGEDETLGIDAFEESLEGLPERRLAAVVVEMFRLEIAQDRCKWPQFQEGTVVLVGLTDGETSVAPPSGTVPAGKNTAERHTRSKVPAFKNMRQQRRDRGLAVGSCDGEDPVVPHQFGKHPGPGIHRNSHRAGSQEFRMVFGDGRCRDQRIRPGGMRGIVTDDNSGSPGTECFQPVGRTDIASADHEAVIEQDLGQSAHAGAPDTHQVKIGPLHQQAPRARSIPPIRAAASGSAMRRAAEPMSWSRAGSARSSRSWRTKASIVASSSRRTTAAPAFSSERALNSW